MVYSIKDNPGLIKVLSFLKSHNSEYLSGQDLSDVLKISRVAVWKHIKKIRELGYKVESKQKEGYRLVSYTDLLLPWEICQGLGTKLIGKEILYYETLGSTQDQAIKISSNSKRNGLVIIAQKQTKGHGRAGRRWVSPKGGIWLSIILQQEFEISVVTLFPLASSLALSKAIERHFEIKPELKWPNDVTIKGKKVAGMLVDASLESNKIEKIVLGVGINYDVNLTEIEKNVKNTPNFYGVTSLKKYKKNVKSVHLVQSFLLELEKIFEELNSGKIKKIIKEWTDRSSTIGSRIEIVTKEGKTRGKALKIDDDGALVISDKKNTRVLAGDIIHLSNHPK